MQGVRLVQVRFTENKGKKLVFTEAGVRLMQGVRLVQVRFTENKGKNWGLLRQVSA